MGFTADNPKRVSDVLKYDIPTYSRDQAIVASGQGVIEIGTVIGRIGVGGAASAAKAGGNTGNGTLTVDVTTPVLAGAKVGIYTVRLIAAAANAGTFRVEDPDGIVLGDVAVGGTFADDIKFATADGATDFVVGDGFDITVAAGSMKIGKLAPAAVNGTQTALGICISRVDATSVDQKAVIVTRHAELGVAGIVWPAGITTPQKIAATAQLEARGIVVRRRAGHPTAPCARTRKTPSCRPFSTCFRARNSPPGR